MVEPNPLPRGGEKREHRFGNRLPRQIRAAGDNLDDVRPGGDLPGKILRAGDALIRRKKPVFGKNALQLADDVALDQHLGIEPGTSAGIAKDVFAPHIHAADHRDFAIDDLQLAMIAQIHETRMPPERERIKPGKTASGLDQWREE